MNPYLFVVALVAVMFSLGLLVMKAVDGLAYFRM